MTGLNTASSRRQPVTSVAEDLNWGQRKQIKQVARAGLEPGTAGLRFGRAHHSATLPLKGSS